MTTADNANKGVDSMPDTRDLTPAINSGSENPGKTASCAPDSTTAPLAMTPLAAVANERRWPGGQRGNQNRTSHGLRGSQFPRGAKSDERATTEFIATVREQWEKDNSRPMGLGEQATLHRLRRAVGQDRLAGRWLRQDGLKLDERLRLTDTMRTAAAMIESCLSKLGYSAAPPSFDDIWNTPARPSLDLQPDAANEPEGSQDAAEPAKAAYDAQEPSEHLDNVGTEPADDEQEQSEDDEQDCQSTDDEMEAYRQSLRNQSPARRPTTSPTESPAARLARFQHESDLREGLAVPITDPLHPCWEPPGRQR